MGYRNRNKDRLKIRERESKDRKWNERNDIFNLGTEKSTIDSEVGNNIDDKDTKVARSKGSKFMESSLTTDDDFTRKNGSRYRKIPTNASPPYQSRIGKENPKGKLQSKKERKERNN